MFHSLHTHGFVRVAASTPRIAVGDPAANADETLALMHDAEARNVDLVLFPELGLSAYAIDDLLLQDALLDRVESEGYAFQIEVSFRAWRKGFRIGEIPIVFADRTLGESKMSKKIIWEAVWKVWKLRFLDLFGRL